MQHSKTALGRLAASAMMTAIVACDGDTSAAGPEDPGDETGQATLSAISESDYHALLSQVDTLTACVTPNASDPTVCNLVLYSGETATWTVFAQASLGASTSGSATELTWDNPEGVNATAIPPVEPTESRWVQVIWDSPPLSRPGSVSAEVRAVVQIGQAVTVAECEVVDTAVGSGVSDCSEGT